MTAFDYKDFDYDGWYAQLKDMRDIGPMARHVRRLIFEIIAQLKFNTILDVSCGQGQLLKEFGQHYPGAELAGTEYSQTGLDLAARELTDVKLYLLDLVTGALDEQFDLVICSEVLEHIVEDRIAIANLLKMTRHYLVVTTIQGRFWPYEQAARGHVRSYTRVDLEGKMREAGYEIIKTIEWGWPFYSPLYRNLLALTEARGTTGSYGPGRRFIAWALYMLFSLNSRTRGDQLVVLAKPSTSASEPLPKT